jgi:hypothetical protein
MQLKNAHVIDEAPRGFEVLTPSAFNTLLELADADMHLIID